ncbi:MAG: SH3 domain-containing protein [Oscillospiraceae bacterium]|nr:SH3 domain-containing protein [Oscillospiraceae bacterium]
MIFSINRKFSRLLSLILVLVMLTTLFAGCKKKNPAEDPTDPGLNLNLNSSESTEDTTEAPETTEPVINEKTATVTQDLKVRSAPTLEGQEMVVLDKGTRIEVSRVEEVGKKDWALVILPDGTSGWVMMDYVEMDIPTTVTPPETTAPAETTPEEDDDKKDEESTVTNIKGVINTNGLNIRSEGSTNGKVQGQYNKGDVVTILETKNGWGRTSKGWIKLDYVNTTGTGTNDKDDDKDTSNKVTISGNGSTTVQFRGIVIAGELNVRADANQSATRVGGLKYGDRVEILEKSGTWGRTKNGWISLNYVYQDGTTGTKTGAGTVTGSELNIRSGPGTGYGTVGSYRQGDRVTILEQFTYNNVTWGCTNKGWISLQYVDMDGDDSDNTTNNNNGSNGNTTTTTGKSGTITGDGLNVRSGPGLTYGSVGTLNSGDRVTVSSTTVGDGITWGNIGTGWVSMAYVQLD